jgi:hypothetical protein
MILPVCDNKYNFDESDSSSYETEEESTATRDHGTPTLQTGKMII